MTTKHTPGPWEINHAGTGRDGKLIYDEVYVYAPSCGVNDVAIASDIADPLGKDAGMANARLIAAAPELLAALIAITTVRCDGMDIAPINAAYSKASEAIAKATGAEMSDA